MPRTLRQRKVPVERDADFEGELPDAPDDLRGELGVHVVGVLVELCEDAFVVLLVGDCEDHVELFVLDEAGVVVADEEGADVAEDLGVAVDHELQASEHDPDVFEALACDEGGW